MTFNTKSHATEHASPIPIMRNVYHIMYKTNDLSHIEVLVVHSVEQLPAVRRVTDSIRPVGESGFFQSLLSNRMRTRPALTTVLRRVGEFNTSLIARLKLPDCDNNNKKKRLES